MRNKSSLFSLSELIIAIIVISVIATITIIQQNNIKHTAFVTQINANVRNIQVAVDRYLLQNNQLPTVRKVTDVNPSLIDFNLLKESDLRNTPNLDLINYWLDSNGKVWASTLELPEKVELKGEEVTWEPVKNVVRYKVEEIRTPKFVTSSVNYSNQKQNNSLVTTESTYKMTGEEGLILISAIDKYDFPTPPVGLLIGTEEQTKDDSGNLYEGEIPNLKESLIDSYNEKEKAEDINVIPNTGNQKKSYSKPIAIIEMLPDTFIKKGEEVSWNSSQSFDPNGGKIVDEVWSGKMKNYPNNQVYRVKLKVKNEQGEWSDWACKQVVIGKGNKNKYEECTGRSD